MAYMSQEKKTKISALLKPILAKYKVKGSLSVRNHSTICLTVKAGAIDFIGNSNKVCGNDFYQVQRGFKPNTTGSEPSGSNVAEINDTTNTVLRPNSGSASQASRGVIQASMWARV